MSFGDFVMGFSPGAVIFLVIGLALMVVEMFTPGFGVPGFSGIVCLIICIILRARTFAEGLWMTMVVLALLGVLLLIFLRSATNGALSRSSIILNDSIEGEANFISSDDLDFFLGKEGKAVTILRPSGIADFDGVRLDVLTEGDFIPAGAPVRVEHRDGLSLVVERIVPIEDDVKSEA